MAKTKTYMARPGEIEAKWHLVDAAGKIVGRLASRLSTILQGKHRPEYTPHVDTGDFIVVINASKVKLTGGAKLDERVYKTYSGYPSGQNLTPAKEMLEKHPERIIIEAVRRMLPKNKLGRAAIRKLKVFPGEEHNHQAQKPQPLEL